MEGGLPAGKELLDVDDVVRYLGVEPTTVWRWCRDGELPCVKVGRYWRIRRGTMEDFLRRGERPATLVGQLRSFLRVPDNVIAIAEDRDLLHRLDAAFFRVAEARDGFLVKFHGGEPDTSTEEARAILERNGLEAGRLEDEGRLRFNDEAGPVDARRKTLEDLLEEGTEDGRTFWVSFDWARHVDLEVALEQQAALGELVETRKLVIKTAVVEEVTDEWSSAERRQAREFHSGTIRLSKTGLDVSRITPLPEL